MGDPPVEMPRDGWFFPPHDGLGRRARLASAGGPAGVPKGKRRDTKRRRKPRRKR